VSFRKRVEKRLSKKRLTKLSSDEGEARAEEELNSSYQRKGLRLPIESLKIEAI